jgi:SiaC family regulatory phosphoprotein
MLNILNLLPTSNTPGFFLNPNGMIEICGRGLYQNKTEDIEHVMNWIDEYLNNPARKTYVKIAFEYLNSFSTTIIVSLLRKLSTALPQSDMLVIQWHYDADDEAMIEQGECISSTFNIPMDFTCNDHFVDY